MWWLIQLVLYGLIIALAWRCCSDPLDDGSRAVRMQVDVNNMGGNGLSITVTRLAIDEQSDTPRKFR
jgi:hypothetical protein